MRDILGMDGPLERYSRGLDTWVPLESEASFGAMKRSIDVQRKAGDGSHTPRVMLRIKPAKTETPVVTQPPSLPMITPPPHNRDVSAPAPQPMSDGRLSFRPFVREQVSLEPPKMEQLSQPPQPPQLPPFGHHMPPHMHGPPPTFFQPPPGPPSGMQMHPPPPPPPPQFPFDHRLRFFPPPLHPNMQGPPPPMNQLGQGPPLPPLVPERPPMASMNSFTQQTDRSSGVSVNTEKTDAEMVLSILNSLEEKMNSMDDKFDQIQLDGRKHYDSLRRGLKRIKEDKPAPAAVDLVEPQPVVPVAPVNTRNYPCCICNYCLKRIFLHSLGL